MLIKEQLRQIYFDLSSGALSQSEAIEKIRAIKMRQQATASTALLCPVWEASNLVLTETVSDYVDHQVLLREIPETNSEPNLARLFSNCAVACFEQIQAILRNKPTGKVLLQIVVPSDGPKAVLAGLSGLLKTAALESPQITGQLIIIPAQTSTAELDQLLQQEKRHGRAAMVRYDRGERQVMRWREVEPNTKSLPSAFQENGVYLITGGLGALGLLFAKEILRRNARVVLTGRQPLTSKIQEMVDGLSAETGCLIYRQIDVANLDQVHSAVEAAHNEWGRLNGILHCAGTIQDNFLLKKTSAEFRDVIESKVAGTFNIDEATQSLELDFFVMFSSIAGALGNVGQADYAVANAFMDQFAAYRSGRVAAKKLYGRTLSINWPLWQDGGMSMDAVSSELFRNNIGFEPIQTEIGIEMFRRCLASPQARILVANGDPARIRRSLLSTVQPLRKPRVAAAVQLVPEDLREKTLYYLCKELSGALKLPAGKIDSQANFGEYGIDSILAMGLTSHLEKSFGVLPK
ncbi:MAG: beta-ketoacyl reductase, partial [Terracidiphilus sp.]